MPAIEARIAVLLVIRVAPNPVWDAEDRQENSASSRYYSAGICAAQWLIAANRFEETMVSGLAVSGIS
jgi:hypothetical protein